jgi:uncharacterized membrane protein
MTTSRLSPVTTLPLVTFVASAWLAAGLFYRDLPNRVPTHWSASWRADGFTAKPWGPFVFPLTMTVVWFARPILRHLSFSRNRTERFPGAFDFRIMLTVGLLFVIWNLVIAYSVFWLRVVAVPASVALIVAGRFLATVASGSVNGSGPPVFVPPESDRLRTRRFVSGLCVVAGIIVLAIVAAGS